MKQKLLFKKLLFFCAFLLPLSVLAQTITGKIIDGNGDAIPFASVVEKGTTNGTTSDGDGNFSLTVNELPTTIIVSSLGFTTKEQEVTDASTPVNITLTEDSVSLEEVVISGLASTIKRSNLANSVATVSASDLTGTTPPQTLDGALSGKFTGALVTANSGAPGGGMSIKLRGVTSINGNSQPLYIIDGVYLDNSSVSSAGLNTVSAAAGGGNASSQDNATNRIADINPNDIANIEILKGASASAIYGSRGAAGVIIITTKKGKAGKTVLNFSQSVGWNEAINLQGQRNWTAELAESAFGEGALFTAAEAAGTLRDYEKEIFGEKGFISNTNVSMSGGSEKTKFFAGLTRNQEDGIVKRTGYDKTSIRLNLDHDFTNNIKFSLSSNYINSSADRGFFNNDNRGTTLGVALTATRPWDFLLPDENGNYPDHPNNSSNPLQTRDLMTNNETTKRFIVGGTLDINLYRSDNSDLKFVARAGTDFYTLSAKVIFPKELQFMKPGGIIGLNGLSAVSTTTNTNANYSAFLVHNYRTENNLSFSTQLGATNEQFSQNIVRVTASDLIASETNVDQAANIATNQARLEQEDFGFYAQESINYQDKLIATLGIRGDKSTNNGDNDEFFYYPKASLAANLHNFGFWGESEVLNRFKVRVAYGEAGTFAAFGSLFTIYGNTLIGGNVGIIVPLIRGNAALLPERQKELELGFDAGFLNDRISVEFTYYKKDVEDLLLQANIEPSTGFNREWVNAGELENTGIEIGLNIKAFNTENFSWDSGISWYTNKSEMTKLSVPTFNLGGFGNSLGQFQIEEGRSVTQIVGTTGPGTPVTVLGDAEPDFQMSFTNNLRYKDFTLSFLWHWKQGGDNINLSKLLSDFGGTSNDFDDFDFDPIINNGTFRINNGLFAGNAKPFVEDASYLRLREVGLYYTIPQETLDKWFNSVVSNVKIGFSGNNLINIFDYNSYDPEVSNFGGNGLSTGVEVTPFPSSKRYMFHLSAQF